jgi:hypothetical protein
MTMKRFAFVAGIVTLLACTAVQAQQPTMPTPAKEHGWLQQLAGEWETEVECIMEPGKPPIKGKGSESARMLGGFWVVAEGKGEMAGMSHASVLTLGYDTEKKKYVGTWVDNCGGYMWKYEGTLDATGKILTLDTEGPCPMRGKVCKFKEVIEFKSADHRTFSSSTLGDDGKWMTFMTANYKRKK